MGDEIDDEGENAPDEIKDAQHNKIQELFSLYRQEGDNADELEHFIRRDKELFQDINKKIKEANALGVVDKLYYKIKLLENTPEHLLSILAGNRILFQIACDRYKKYHHHYWLKIDKDTLSKVNGKQLDDTVNAADEIIESLDQIFKYHLRSDVTDEEHNSIDYGANEIIKRGEQKLNHIMPIFLILSKQKALNKIAREVEKLAQSAKESDESAKRTKKEVEELGEERLLDFESKYFKETADKHEEKCKSFLQWAVGLGGGTIVWGLLSQLFFARQDKICENAESFNSVLCWLLDINVREILIGGILVAGIVACLRAYFANAHGESINRHRFNSLQIYSKGRKLIDAKDRDVFLQKATEAIFEQLPTGFTKYHKEDSKSSDNSAQPALIAASIAAAIKATTKDGS